MAKISSKVLSNSHKEFVVQVQLTCIYLARFNYYSNVSKKTSFFASCAKVVSHCSIYPPPHFKLCFYLPENRLVWNSNQVATGLFEEKLPMKLTTE